MIAGLAVAALAAPASAPAAGGKLVISPQPGTLDASRNWWGDISGPTIASNPGGLGQTITDPGSQVVYRPWLIYGTDADPTAAGFHPSAGPRWVAMSVRIWT